MKIIRNPHGHPELIPGRMFQCHFCSQLGNAGIFYIDNINRMVPDTSFTHIIGQAFVHTIDKPVIAPAGSFISTGDFYSSKLPVMHIHYSISVDIDIIGVFPVMIIIVLYRIIESDYAICMRCAVRPGSHHIFPPLSRPGVKYHCGMKIFTVQVCQSSDRRSFKMIIKPVFQCLQSFRSINPDGAHVIDPV